MKIYDRDYRTGELTLIGTIRIINGKLQFDLSKDDYEMIVGRAPLDQIDPADFIAYTKGRFAMQTGIATEDEDEYDGGIKRNKRARVEAPMTLLKDHPDWPIDESKIFYSTEKKKK
ncbi:MAG: hypothetical protein A4E66_00476 [Syntrophus sp. PtaB.Bin001]|nr:MAG: hypothetical protein A4E66_00476 [Syntrophus sp. PtaB.Bin001]